MKESNKVPQHAQEYQDRLCFLKKVNPLSTQAHFNYLKGSLDEYIKC